MKRVVPVILSVLQALLLLGIAELLWLDKKSMGVVRYLANKNRVWNQAQWAGWFLIAAAAVMAVMLIWAVVMLKSRKTRGAKRQWSMLTIFSISTISFVFMAETATVRPYYFISIILITVVILQLVKCVSREPRLVENNFYFDHRYRKSRRS